MIIDMYRIAGEYYYDDHRLAEFAKSELMRLTEDLDDDPPAVLRTQVAVLAAMVAFTSDIESLRDDIRSIDDKLTSIESTVSGAESKISSVDREISSLRSEVSSISRSPILGVRGGAYGPGCDVGVAT